MVIGNGETSVLDSPTSNIMMTNHGVMDNVQQSCIDDDNALVDPKIFLQELDRVCWFGSFCLGIDASNQSLKIFFTPRGNHKEKW